MKTLDDLFKKPETFKEKLEDLWYDISYYYPSLVRDFWYGIQRFFRNTWRYRDILWSDNDFDYGYLESIILKKLSFMADYFRISRIVEGEEDIYHKINLALRIGKIAFSEDDDPENYDEHFRYTGYINTKNYKRYWPQISEEDFNRLLSYNKTELRRIKAKKIFYRILSKYSWEWWD